MTKPDNSLQHLPLFIAIESHPESIKPGSSMLSRSMAQQLLAHLSADLSTILPAVQTTAMTTAAALYDQSQLLRPGLPIFKTLSELLEASFSGQDFQPRLLAFGAHKGRLPNLTLMPDSNLSASPFQLIPLQLSAAGGEIDAIAEALEHQLLENGQLSAHSAQWLQEELEQKIIHARFMTLNDLLAMLYMQLERIGLDPLWKWLEQMLKNPDFEANINLDGGPEINYRAGEVQIHFLSFDQWVLNATEKAATENSAQQYLGWLNQYRQATLLLQAHGLSVEICGIDTTAQPQNNSIGQQTDGLYCESTHLKPATDNITHHYDKQLGLIATSVSCAGQQFNYYPLKPSGLEELRALLAERYPGNLTTDTYNGLCINQSGQNLSINNE